jgi:translation initiation factor 4A
MAAAANTTVTSTSPEGDSNGDTKRSSDWYIAHSSDSFQDMNLPRAVLKGVFSYGFDKPSQVQQIAIQPMMDKRDVIVQANSGTGKTGAFLIGTLARIADRKKKSRHPHALVISPARELAEQTNHVCSSFTAFMEEHNTTLLIGGTNTHDNMRDLDSGASIAIGTPGRIYDMMARGFFNTSELDVLVIDEADEMLKLGFKD